MPRTWSSWEWCRYRPMGKRPLAPQTALDRQTLTQTPKHPDSAGRTAPQDLAPGSSRELAPTLPPSLNRRRILQTLHLEMGFLRPRRLSMYRSARCSLTWPKGKRLAYRLEADHRHWLR